MSFANVTIFFVSLLLCNAVFAEVGTSGQPAGVNSTNNHDDQSKFERVGGNFKVTRIQRLSDGSFKVVFKSTSPANRFETLVLESPHVHVAVTEGKEIRLSAEISSHKGNSAIVSQMVIFLPGRVGDTPVWLVSKGTNSSSPPAKLLEMHAPSTDYQIL
jgi:hypothetical protein